MRSEDRRYRALRLVSKRIRAFIRSNTGIDSANH